MARDALSADHWFGVFTIAELKFHPLVLSFAVSGSLRIGGGSRLHAMLKLAIRRASSAIYLLQPAPLIAFAI